jgi:TorA maturation chaperone TorD
MNEILEDCEIRSKIYRLLKNVFLKPPSQEFLNYLRELNGVNDSASTPDVVKGLELLRKGANCEPEKLSLEHTRLFIGPYKLPAPPYESVYRTDERLVMQQPTIEVRKAYLQAGLEVKGIYTNPDDHISAELEFMEYLCNKTASFLKNRDAHEAVKHLELQRKFLEEHLSKWVAAFSEDILRNTEQDFYRGAALLLRGFISLETERITKIMPAVKKDPPLRYRVPL